MSTPPKAVDPKAQFPDQLLDMQVSSPTGEFLNQKLWGWDPVICVFISHPGDSRVFRSLTATASEDSLH